MNLSRDRARSAHPGLVDVAALLCNWVSVTGLSSADPDPLVLLQRQRGNGERTERTDRRIERQTDRRIDRPQTGGVTPAWFLSRPSDDSLRGQI